MNRPPTRRMRHRPRRPLTYHPNPTYPLLSLSHMAPSACMSISAASFQLGSRLSLGRSVKRMLAPCSLLILSSSSETTFLSSNSSFPDHRIGLANFQSLARVMGIAVSELELAVQAFGSSGGGELLETELQVERHYRMIQTPETASPLPYRRPEPAVRPP